MREDRNKSAFSVPKLLSIILASLLLAGCGPSNTVPTYNVSGRVTLAEGGSGLSGVKIACGNQGTTETRSDGSWTMYGLKGTVSILPSKAGYDFEPSSRTVSGADSNVNFVASPIGTYSASGYVRDSLGAPLPDVRVEFDRGFTSVTTTHDGKWIKYGLFGTVVARPKKDGWTFSPLSRTVIGTASNVDFAGTYRAGGVVRDADGSAVPSVRLDFSGGHSSVHTDSYGRWTRDGLFGDVIVTPSLSDWTFSPPTHTITSPHDEYNFTRTYTVSGRVTDQQGNGVRSIAIRFSGEHYSSLTDENGYWIKEGLSGPITVTPEAIGYTFNPPHLIVDRPSSNVNFTAVPKSAGYSVSGRVTDQYGAGITDVLVFLGRGFGTVRTGSNGFWSASELSGDVTVTPAKTGLVFAPVTVTVSGSSSNVDFVGNPVTNAYTVSGKVIDSRNGSGLYKVSFTFSGGFGRTQSDVYGNWSKSGLYGTVTVTPSRPGWTFVPESRVVTGTDSLVDFSGTPTGSSASDGGGR